MLNRGANIVLLERESAQVVAGRPKIDIEAKRFFVCALGLFYLARAVVGQAAVVPRLRIARQMFGRVLKLLDCLCEVALLDQLCAGKQGAGPGIAATGEQQQDKNGTGKLRSGAGFVRSRNLDDQHLSWWYHRGLAVSRNAGLYTRFFSLRRRAAVLSALVLVSGNVSLLWSNSADVPAPSR